MARKTREREMVEGGANGGALRNGAPSPTSKKQSLVILVFGVGNRVWGASLALLLLSSLSLFFAFFGLDKLT